jgi:hypothetical protein
VAVKYTNNAKTTLASGLTNSATSATVTDGSVFPSLGAGEYFYITFDDGSNNEIAKVTARSGNALTIVRAQDNTSARAFSTGDSAELRVIAAVLTEIQENIAAKSANQTVYSATAASNATDYNIGVDPGVEANASVFLDGVYQHHDTFSFSGSTLTFDAAPTNGTKIEVVVDNLINLQSSNLTVDTFTATSGQTAFTLSDAPGGESNVLAFIDGVFQNQASFTLSSNTLTFDTGVVVGRSVTVYTINPVNIGTPSDNTVTSAKLSGNITLPGSLTVGSYDVAFDSPTFVVDNSNSRVGIGTASPASGALDVVGEVHISSHLDMPDDAIIKLGTGDDLQIYHDASAGHSYIKDAGTGNLSINTDSQVNMYDTANSGWLSKFIAGGAVELYHAGSKKIETTSGGISVTGTGTYSGSVALGGATVANDYLLEMTPSAGNIWRSTRGSSVVAAYQTNNSHVYIGTTSNNELRLIQNDATALTIDTSKNVGIGDTDPFSKLHVEDTGWSSGSPYGTVAYIEGGGVNDLNWGHLVVSQSGTTTDTGGRISLGANGQNPIAGLRAKYKGATYGDLAFLTRPSGGTNTERMLITSAGAVEMYQSLTIHKTVTGANDQEMLTIMRNGGSTSDGARQASIAFFDGDNDTYTGKISGYRDSPAGNYDGGLRFYVNPHATNANATFAELNNTPALYMNPDQTSTFHGQAVLGQSSSNIGNYTSNNSGHTTLNYGKIGHQYNSTGTAYTFGTYTHPSAMYGTKSDGSTASWNRLLWINHRASYMITIWTSGGWYGPSAHTIKVDTNYTNSLSVKTVSEGTAGSYSYAVRFTAPNAGTGGGWLDFQNTGGSSGGSVYSGIYISVTPLRGTDFVFASLKSEAVGDTVSTLTYTVTKTNASDY